MSGGQCTLRLWSDWFRRELATPVDSSSQARFDEGNEVGELARKRFWACHYISFDDRHGASNRTGLWLLSINISKSIISDSRLKVLANVEQMAFNFV